MAANVTARDIPARQFIPLLSQYLQQSGKMALPCPFSKNSEKMIQFEKWYFEIAASTLHQFYLHPSFPNSISSPHLGVSNSLRSRRASYGSQDLHRNQTQKMAQATKFAQSACFSQFQAIGWLVKDPTGIIFASKEAINEMDSIAKQASQAPAKSI
ncbi:hypothetical protein TRFO_29997 [Tritrichomonas foetus]|uniref:Uncharacterized protein n=1 Tax=Tritrichomonas foetus TaxID=1144522 RepID=A0A1J4JYZ5_9EUKA|nr:hypothetical protein TRFO_29997 [Tritrichomonas foetus]|eukprot:OHT02756.1 hypothetical protein TRFO_29997 [Tritrichomonas foetus]